MSARPDWKEQEAEAYVRAEGLAGNSPPDPALEFFLADVLRDASLPSTWAVSRDNGLLAYTNSTTQSTSAEHPYNELLRQLAAVCKETLQLAPEERSIRLRSLHEAWTHEAKETLSKWQPLVDKDSGQTYYYNAKTQETMWEDPNQVVGPPYQAKLGALAKLFDDQYVQKLTAMTATSQLADSQTQMPPGNDEHSTHQGRRGSFFGALRHRMSTSGKHKADDDSATHAGSPEGVVAGTRWGDGNEEWTESDSRDYVMSLGLEWLQESAAVVRFLQDAILSSSLPKPWVSCRDEGGRFFFRNTATKDVSQQHPCDQDLHILADMCRAFLELSPEERQERIVSLHANWTAEAETAVSKWTPKVSRSTNRRYFSNSDTGETMWEDPAEVIIPGYRMRLESLGWLANSSYLDRLKAADDASNLTNASPSDEAATQKRRSSASTEMPPIKESAVESQGRRHSRGLFGGARSSSPNHKKSSVFGLGKRFSGTPAKLLFGDRGRRSSQDHGEGVPMPRAESEPAPRQSFETSTKWGQGNDEWSHEECFAYVERLGIAQLPDEMALLRFLRDALRDSPLPSNWIAKRDPYSVMFFKNSLTSVVTQQHPYDEGLQELAAVCRECLSCSDEECQVRVVELHHAWTADAQAALAHWVPKVSKSTNRKYYSNSETGETMWNEPSDVVLPLYRMRLEALNRLLDSDYKARLKASEDSPAVGAAEGAATVEAKPEPAAQQEATAPDAGADVGSWQPADQTVTSGAAVVQANAEWTQAERQEYILSLNLRQSTDAPVMRFLHDILSAAVLPPAWVSLRDQSGRLFFTNTSTQAVSWKHPWDEAIFVLAETCAHCLALSPEQQYAWLCTVHGSWTAEAQSKVAKWHPVDQDGQAYYYHEETKETMWENPAEVVLPIYQYRLESLGKLFEPEYISMLQVATETRAEPVQGMENAALSSDTASRADADGTAEAVAPVEGSERSSKKWERRVSRTTKKVYYWNPETNETTWEKPVEDVAPSAPASATPSVRDTSAHGGDPSSTTASWPGHSREMMEGHQAPRHRSSPLARQSNDASKSPADAMLQDRAVEALEASSNRGRSSERGAYVEGVQAIAENAPTELRSNTQAEKDQIQASGKSLADLAKSAGTGKLDESVQWTAPEQKEYILALGVVSLPQDSAVVQYLQDVLGEMTLPSPWIITRNERGQLFFKNLETKGVSWKHPYDRVLKQLSGICRDFLKLTVSERREKIQVMTETWKAETKSSLEKWICKVSRSKNKNYYVNTDTGETMWQNPANVIVPVNTVRADAVRKLLDDSYCAHLREILIRELGASQKNNGQTTSDADQKAVNHASEPRGAALAVDRTGHDESSHSKAPEARGPVKTFADVAAAAAHTASPSVAAEPAAWPSSSAPATAGEPEVADARSCGSSASLGTSLTELSHAVSPAGGAKPNLLADLSSASGTQVNRGDGHEKDEDVDMHAATSNAAGGSADSLAKERDSSVDVQQKLDSQSKEEIGDAATSEMHEQLSGSEDEHSGDQLSQMMTLMQDMRAQLAESNAPPDAVTHSELEAVQDAMLSELQGHRAAAEDHVNKKISDLLAHVSQRMDDASADQSAEIMAQLQGMHTELSEDKAQADVVTRSDMEAQISDVLSQVSQILGDSGADQFPEMRAQLQEMQDQLSQHSVQADVVTRSEMEGQIADVLANVSQIFGESSAEHLSEIRAQLQELQTTQPGKEVQPEVVTRSELENKISDVLAYVSQMKAESGADQLTDVKAHLQEMQAQFSERDAQTDVVTRSDLEAKISDVLAYVSQTMGASSAEQLSEMRAQLQELQTQPPEREVPPDVVTQSEFQAKISDLHSSMPKIMAESTAHERMNGQVSKLEEQMQEFDRALVGMKTQFLQEVEEMRSNHDNKLAEERSKQEKNLEEEKKAMLAKLDEVHLDHRKKLAEERERQEKQIEEEKQAMNQKLADEKEKKEIEFQEENKALSEALEKEKRQHKEELFAELDKSLHGLLETQKQHTEQNTSWQATWNVQQQHSKMEAQEAFDAYRQEAEQSRQDAARLKSEWQAECSSIQAVVSHWGTTFSKMEGEMRRNLEEQRWQSDREASTRSEWEMERELLRLELNQATQSHRQELEAERELLKVELFQVSQAHRQDQERLRRDGAMRREEWHSEQRTLREEIHQVSESSRKASFALRQRSEELCSQLEEDLHRSRQERLRLNDEDLRRTSQWEADNRIMQAQLRETLLSQSREEVNMLRAESEHFRKQWQAERGSLHAEVRQLLEEQKTDSISAKVHSDALCTHLQDSLQRSCKVEQRLQIAMEVHQAESAEMQRGISSTLQRQLQDAVAPLAVQVAEAERRLAKDVQNTQRAQQEASRQLQSEVGSLRTAETQVLVAQQQMRETLRAQSEAVEKLQEAQASRAADQSRVADASILTLSDSHKLWQSEAWAVQTSKVNADQQRMQDLEKQHTAYNQELMRLENDLRRARSSEFRLQEEDAERRMKNSMERQEMEWALEKRALDWKQEYKQLEWKADLASVGLDGEPSSRGGSPRREKSRKQLQLQEALLTALHMSQSQEEAPPTERRRSSSMGQKQQRPSSAMIRRR